MSVRMAIICLPAKIMENKALDNFPISFRTPARNPLSCSQNTLATDNQISIMGKCIATVYEGKVISTEFSLVFKTKLDTLMGRS